MFAANDPPSTPTAPGVPYLTVGRDGGVAKLTWSEADDGASAITNYTVLRGTASGNVAFLANAGTTPKPSRCQASYSRLTNFTFCSEIRPHLTSKAGLSVTL